ncbi:hypothetical protein KO516_00930 [Citreicella sp. C3M06]|nr:hypothetical protein [Citreicella sp. C3M06]
MSTLALSLLQNDPYWAMLTPLISPISSVRLGIGQGPQQIATGLRHAFGIHCIVAKPFSMWTASSLNLPQS